jgi:hypothetical protein
LCEGFGKERGILEHSEWNAASPKSRAHWNIVDHLPL